MPARLFHCNIHNTGTGRIEWVADDHSEGIWSDGQSPSETAKIIDPGGMGSFQAESGGEFPIIGSIGKGTTGWALFRTNAIDSIGSPYSAFITVTWDVPYWGVKNAQADAHADRFNFRDNPSPGEFDDRDLSPPNLSINYFRDRSNGNPSVQDVPWIFVMAWPAMGGFDILWDGKAYMEITIGGSVPPSEPERFPGFPQGQAIQPTPVPLRGSSSSLWLGSWESDDLKAVITQRPKLIPGVVGLFDVVVTNKKTGHSTTTNNVGISRASVVLSAGTANLGLMSSSGGTAAGASNFRLEVHQNVGTADEVRQAITKDHPAFGAILDSSREIIGASLSNTQRIGGDYLSLSGDATLEICKMVYKGRTVGYSLHYRHPSSVPAGFTVIGIDELMTRPSDIG